MMIANKKRLVLWGVLCGLFFAFGFWIHKHMISSGAHEIFGYDYNVFMRQMRDVNWITYTGVRHPGLGLVMCPVVLIAAGMDIVSDKICDVFLLAVMAIIVTTSVWVVKIIGGWIAAVVFICFGFTWVLAATPESFPVAMLSLLTVVWFSGGETESNAWNKSDWIWVILFVCCSAITITNGIKVVLAYVICNWTRLKTIRIKMFGGTTLMCAVVVGICLMLFIVIGYFTIRMACWNMAHPESPKTIQLAIAQTLRWIPDGLGVWGRVRGCIMNFITVPLIPRIDFSIVSSPDAPSVIGMLWSGILFVWAGVSAVWNWRIKRVQVMIGMFVVDLFIHVICGWGLSEGWIFCAHWFWMVPILIGLSFLIWHER